MGTQKYNEFLIAKSKFFKSLQNGEWYKNKYGDDWEKIFNKINSKYHIGIASKASLKVFLPLYKILRKKLNYNLYDILFGIRGLKEYLIYDNISKTRNLYDFTIISDKIIIEFNGDCSNNKNNLLKSIHPNYHKLSYNELNKWKHPYRNISAFEKIEEDKNKIKIAENAGFKVLEIWQSDGKEYNLQKCLEFINEVRSNN